MQEVSPLRADQDTVNLDQELQADIAAFIRKFVVLDDDQAKVASYWVLHTWTFQVAVTTPYLFVYSAKPGAGKTRFLDVMGVIACNAKRADDMTAPIMFKLIQREEPCVTLMIDEVDTLWSGSRNEHKRRILNTGYKLGGVAWREEAREVKAFSTFGPKILAGIRNGFLPATLVDRSIPIEMRPKTKDETCEPFIEHYVRASEELNGLQRRIDRFAEDRLVDIQLAAPTLSRSLTDRQLEICEPLLKIACVFGDQDELTESLERLFRQRGSVAKPEDVLLKRIKSAFGEQHFIYSDDLCNVLGRSFSPKLLASALSRYGIKPVQRRDGNQVRRGYNRSDFIPTWVMMGYWTTAEPEESET